MTISVKPEDIDSPEAILHYMDQFPLSGQNRAAAKLIRELLTPSAPLGAVSDTTTQKLLKVLERISKAGLDCGCSPCVGQCRCDEANEINLQGVRDLADRTLAEYRALAGQVAPQATDQRRISADESEPDFWPIAKITVIRGQIVRSVFYAPALPDGEHDVFPSPTCLDEHTAAWYGVVQALDAAAPGWQLQAGKNGIESAVLAIQRLAAVETGFPVSESTSKADTGEIIRKAVNAALEMAATQCDTQYMGHDNAKRYERAKTAKHCAASIRALKSATPSTIKEAPAAFSYDMTAFVSVATIKEGTYNFGQMTTAAPIKEEPTTYSTDTVAHSVSDTKSVSLRAAEVLIKSGLKTVRDDFKAEPTGEQQ